VAIAGVTPGSPADRAGIRPGVALVAIDRRTVFDSQSYCESVPADEGAQVTLTLQDVITQEQVDVQLAVGNG
jgi:predicted metalloprotease with PDZ domain